MQPRSRERWVVFYSTHNRIEAEIVLGVLRDAGVPAVLQEAGASIYGAGMRSILVPRERLEEAQQVVDKAKEAAEQQEGDNGHYGE
ncbi:MAG: DUF2007 domain-containing protein [Armatimonadota bacterium]